MEDGWVKNLQYKSKNLVLLVLVEPFIGPVSLAEMLFQKGGYQGPCSKKDLNKLFYQD